MLPYYLILMQWIEIFSVLVLPLTFAQINFIQFAVNRLGCFAASETTKTVDYDLIESRLEERLQNEQKKAHQKSSILYRKGRSI